MNNYLKLTAILFTLSNTVFAQKQVSSRSEAIKVDIKHTAPIITIVQPNVKKGETYYNTESKITIKGTVKTDHLSYFTVDKIETPVDVNGNFSQDVKLKLEQNIIVLKAVDRLNHISYDTVIVNRPLTADAVALNKTNGKNYALLIGTNKYQNMPQLSNPVFDARTISHELKDNYGFETDTVFNPNMNGIYTALRKYSSMQFSDDDQLFIFIAGHGEFDDIFKDGYIVPSDAVKNDNNKASYISHSNLRTIINNIPCKHIFLVMDVCFGGTFDQMLASRGTEKEENTVEREKYIKRKMKNKTRLYLTSGGKEYVPDGRPGAHSPFARKFLEALRHYGGEDKILTFSEVLGYVEKATPEPMHGEFGTNEPGSDFLFISK